MTWSDHAHSTRFRASGAGAVVLLLAVTLLACSAPASTPGSAKPPTDSQAAAPIQAAATPGGAVAGAPAPRPLQSVKYGVPGIDLSVLPLTVGSWKGYFREEGLDVELVRVGGQASIPALLNGEMTYVYGWTSVSSGLVQGAPVKLVGILLDRPPHVVVVQPQIGTLRDLRGQRVGIARAGSADQQVVERALETVGLQLDDVELVRLGDTSTRFAALQSGQIEAAGLIQPFTAEAEKLGMKVLARGSDLMQVPLGVVAVSEPHRQGKPDQVRRLLRALVRNLSYLHDPANREEMVRLAAEHFQLDPPLAPTLVEDQVRIVPRNGEIPDAALESALLEAAQQVDRPSAPPVGSVVDFSLLREARREVGLP